MLKYPSRCIESLTDFEKMKRMLEIAQTQTASVDELSFLDAAAN